MKLFRHSEPLEILRNMFFVVLFLVTQLLIGMTVSLKNSVTSQQVFDSFSAGFLLHNMWPCVAYMDFCPPVQQ